MGGSHAQAAPGVRAASGLLDVAEGFNRAYRLDARYRTAHHGSEVVPEGGAGLIPTRS